MIVMAHLKTKATTSNPEQRAESKWLLVRGLYDRGLEREQIIKLFQIIDRMMTLPNPLQQNLDFKIQKFEEERTMPLLSNMELRGVEIGALRKAQDDIKTVLQIRLGQVPSDIEEALNNISDLSILEEMLKSAVMVNSLDEFKQSLGNM
jgi:hypothetical protein